ncbi:MAG: MFS transporter [Gammaproteobacteria bacterium]|nr:MFS transporter [Gammaproteobacteria bacterium]
MHNNSTNTGQGIVLLFVPVFIMLGAVLIAPILGLMFQHFAGTPYFEILVPLLLTAPALCLALFSPFAGALANRWGAKKLLVISLGLYGFMGCAPVFLDSLYAILASRIVLGIAEAGIVTAGMVLTAHYFSGDARQKWIAYQNIALPLIGAGLLYIVSIVSAIDWRYTFALYGLSFLVFIAAMIVLYEPAQQIRQTAQTPPPMKLKLPLRPMLIIAAIAIPGSIAFYTVPVKLSFLLQDVGENSPAAAGRILSYALVFGTPAGAIMARLLKTWSFGKSLCVAMSMMGAGLIALALADDIPTITASVILQQAGGGLMLTTALTYVLFIAPKEHSGQYAGFWWLVYTLANFATPLCLSALDVATTTLSSTVIVVGVLTMSMSLWLIVSRDLKGSMIQEA